MKEYLGDGVYASFDGYQVWLHVNHHDAPPCVALEPAVIDALCRYYMRMSKPQPAGDDGQPDEKTEWRDYDPDC